MEKPKHGMLVETHKGYPINLLGSGYNCPPLSLWGYYTDAQLKRAINKKLKAMGKTV